MSSDAESSAPLGPADKTPTLDDLLRPTEFERCVRPFLVGAIDAIALFDVRGAAHARATLEASPVVRWDQAPPEVEAAARGGPGRFGLEAHIFEVRPTYAGTERVGVLVISTRAEVAGELEASVASGLDAVVGQLMQSGFATWVTSEMHLAASESHYQALTHRNAELERAIEHLRELDALKSNFLATVSHELRTPLTSIIGFAEMLLEGLAGSLAEEQADYVKTILSRGEELLALITQILEMSRLEVGAIRLELRPIEVRELLEGARSAVELSATRSGVGIELDLQHIPAVIADPEKMHRVFVNLIGNAIKFSPEGSRVRVSAEVAPIRRPFAEETLFGEEIDDAIRVTVADQGIGIPPEQIERIFDAFYQVDAGPTRAHGGAGLGLSIVKSLVQAHGGEVWADSEVGKGTRVHVTIPMATRPVVAEGA